VRISGLGQRGDGIVDTPAGPLYVPYALPGETVDVESWPGQPDRRKLVRITAASPARVVPICPYFGTCGGCALQHWRAADYLAWKRVMVVEAMAQVGLSPSIDEIVDAHGEGRRRVVLHARHGRDRTLKVGFAVQKAHELVAIDRCPILVPNLTGVFEAARAIAQVLASEGKPLDIQATATEAGLDIDVRGSGRLTAVETAEFARIAGRYGLTRLTRHGELVVQRALPALTMGRARVALPAGAFLQATAAGEQALAQLVREHCGDAPVIADLFAGIGPFTLRLAEHARVTAIDSDASAIAALKQAAAVTPGLKRVETHVRDLFRRPLLPSELKPFDCVVFDPPRQGAQAQARELAASGVRTVIAVSCDRGTFARDVRILVDGGYQLLRVTPVDQFRFSPHVELVALFQRTPSGQKRTAQA
jgi:23S rRNA (uracil1939-C5)-methyltransferase